MADNLYETTLQRSSAGNAAEKSAREADALENLRLPEVAPIPDVGDTSYLSAPFQAPPRIVGDRENQVLSVNESQLPESGGSQPVRLPIEGTDDSKANQPAQVDESGVNASQEKSAKKSVVAAVDSGVYVGGRRLGRHSRTLGERLAARVPQVSDELYEAATAHFLSSYRNPLDEEVVWDSPKVRIPLIWWVFLALSLLASVLVLVIVFFFPELVDIPQLHSISHKLLIFMVLTIVFVGWVVSFVRLRKPAFWNKFHTIYASTMFFWGFGGVSGLSSLVVTAWVDLTYVYSDTRDIVSLILPISLWAAFITIIPIVILTGLLPAWERHAPLMRLGGANLFWGAYAGVVLTIVAPYIPREQPGLSFALLVLAALPTAGVFTMGVAVSLPIHWPVSSRAYLNYVLGILILSFGYAVIMFYAFATMGVVGSIVLTLIILLMAGVGLWAILGIKQSPDPLLRDNLENLQVWVDADVISPDEHELMCNEDSVHKWGSTALYRGAFIAARDYYRAVMQLTLLDFGDEGAQDLANVIRMTRRKLEAAGVPPYTNFESFSEAPIYPDVVS